jgi:hypothetical protein
MWVKLRDPDSAGSPVPAGDRGAERDAREDLGEGKTAPAVEGSAMFDSDDDEEEHGERAKKAIATSKPTGKGKDKHPAPGAAPLGGVKTVEVEFDLTLSAYGNARKMYTQKKVAYVKEAKTVEASAKVLQQVGERVLQGVENQKLKRSLRAARKASKLVVW